MRLDGPNWSRPSIETRTTGALVQVWRLRLDDLDDAPARMLPSLTVPAERDRARQYRQEGDFERHLAGRALLRSVLSHRYQCAPRGISLVEDANGKPRVDAPLAGQPAPEFNIAHAGGVVVVALSRGRPVGIDVESLDRETDAEALAGRVLTTTEQKHWRTREEDRFPFFIHVWTCKEAFLKATGQGLRRGAQSVECAFGEEAVTGLRDLDRSPTQAPTEAPRWALRTFRPCEGVAGALVRQHSIPQSLLWVDGAPLINRMATDT